MKLTVGQELWYVPSEERRRRNAPSHAVRVKAVGRKWAQIELLSGNMWRDYGRIDMQTMFADAGGYASPGRCYLSEAAHLEHLEVQKVWEAFCVKALRWAAPAGLTLENLRAAEALLLGGSE